MKIFEQITTIYAAVCMLKTFDDVMCFYIRVAKISLLYCSFAGRIICDARIYFDILGDSFLQEVNLSNNTCYQSCTTSDVSWKVVKWGKLSVGCLLCWSETPGQHISQICACISKGTLVKVMYSWLVNYISNMID